MRIYLYFADKTLIFTDETSPARFFAVDLPQGGRISRTKILNFLETHNDVAVCTPDPEQAFSLFRQEFAAVEAAGGVVVNDRGEYLMITATGAGICPKDMWSRAKVRRNVPCAKSPRKRELWVRRWFASFAGRCMPIICTGGGSSRLRTGSKCAFLRAEPLNLSGKRESMWLRGVRPPN